MLILVVLAGIFSPIVKANAGPIGFGDAATTTLMQQNAATSALSPAVPGATTGPNQAGATTPATGAKTPSTGIDGEGVGANTALYDNLQNCNGAIMWGKFDGCVERIFYFLLYVIPAFLLEKSAQLFDALVNLGINSSLFHAPFIPVAWAIVRDLSNIFFILVLLYIAIRMILNIGGSETKKMVTMVIIMALLINFSMFFTEVVIDSTNILALVFYNKLEVDAKVPNPGGGTTTVPIPSFPVTSNNEKSISAAIANNFDPSQLLKQPFYDALKNKSQVEPVTMKETVVVPTVVAGGIVAAGVAVGTGAAIISAPVVIPAAVAVGSVLYGGNLLYKAFVPSNEVPVGAMLAVILVSGAIMLFAAYAFFVSGFYFLSRLIELWVLIIFSPFAFMSFTIPLLEKVEFIGWDEWLSRLLKASFMAPIFMFFLYFIFLLIQTDLFGPLKNLQNSGTPTSIIIFILIPAILILVLLLQATKYAKKASGVVGEELMKGAKVVGGFALGTALGGASVLGTATVGRAGAMIAESKWAKDKEREGVLGMRFFNKAMKGVGSSNFDIRGAKIGGKTLASATGMSVGEARKGGFAERRKEQVERKQKRAKELEVSEDEPAKQEVRRAEAALRAKKSEMLEGVGIDGKKISKQSEIARLTNGSNNEDSNKAKEALKKAKEALDADPENEEKKRALATAEERVVATKGVGKMEREVAAAERKVADADRELKYAIDRFGVKSKEAEEARGTQTAYVKEKNDLRTILDTRQQNIRDLEGPIKDAENALKAAENVVITENNRRNVQYADKTESGMNQAIDFVLSGGQHSFRGAREASNRIRAEIKEEKAIKQEK